MQYGNLTFQLATEAPKLLAKPTQQYLADHTGLHDVWVSAIDPALADTAAFCENYAIGLDVSANCVVVAAKRGERVWYAACVVLATTRADVNGTIRKALDARKVSFAPMDTALSLAGMEYGGITPIGLPADWPIYVDGRVVEQERLILGSGIRGSKILTTSQILKMIKNVEVMDISKA
jgi:prolyl-tRNA editing enzyme YbaK/EbsC (Cys-tRNA(Pro) deacylase)